MRQSVSSMGAEIIRRAYTGGGVDRGRVNRVLERGSVYLTGERALVCSIERISLLE